MITGHAGSPLTKLADVVFLTVAHESRGEAIASRIAQMTIVDSLYVIVSLSMLDIATANEDKIWKAIIQKTL